jgi:hypothetical protein
MTTDLDLHPFWPGSGGANERCSECGRSEGASVHQVTAADAAQGFPHRGDAHGRESGQPQGAAAGGRQQPEELGRVLPSPQERGAGRRALVTAGSHPAEVLAERLWDAGLRAEHAGRTAAALLTDPDRGPGCWVGPVELGPGIALWVTVPDGGGT